MSIKHNKNVVRNSQMLRRNMTDEEKKLWYKFLKPLPITFNRQKIIDDYIVDFYCSKAKLIIEIDGSQHYEDKGIEKDRLRDDYLNSLGLKVLRFTNREVNSEFDNVCNEILRHLNLI